MEKVCQVLECNGTVVARCVNVNCPFTAVCAMHYFRQHDSHANQIHVDLNKRVRIV